MNKKGFSLVEIMVATSMLTLAGAAMVGISQLSNQDSLQLRATRVVLTARSQIEAALKNPASWRQTVAQNASFACVTTGCSLALADGGYYNFVLFGSNIGEKVTYDASDLTTRHSIRGGPCPSATAAGDSLCPIKYVARWKPLCEIYPCLNPTLDIKVSLVLDFGTSAPPLSPEKYGFATVRGIDDGSLQSACFILNGSYNSATGTCTPKNAGKSCAVTLGRPAQIISSVSADGDITCAPLYSGACLPASQVMNAISALGVAQCTAKVTPATCPTPCIGGWGVCSVACGGGTQTYAVITPETNGGPACTTPAPGDTQACNPGACPVDCVGNWSACSAPCGGGTMTYSITTAAASGGAACPNSTGDSLACNPAPCGPPVDCAGFWGACNLATGIETYTITTAPSGGGIACPVPLTRTCPVACVGSWDTCAAGPGFRTYTWTTPPLNGGAACPYTNGQTDAVACAGGNCGPAVEWITGSTGEDGGGCSGPASRTIVDNGLSGPLLITNTAPGFTGSATVRCYDGDPVVGNIAAEWIISGATCAPSAPYPVGTWSFWNALIATPDASCCMTAYRTAGLRQSVCINLAGTVSIMSSTPVGIGVAYEPFVLTRYSDGTCLKE